MALTPWKILNSEIAFKNPYWNIVREAVELPDGSVNPDFFVNDKAGGAMAFAMTEAGSVVMNREYKHGARQVVTEFAIGGLKDGEDPLAAAQRELLEETGYGGGEWESLGAYAPNPTSSRAKFHIFMARNVRKMSEPFKDPQEIIETFLADPKDLPGMVARGEIIPTASIAAAFLALMKLGILDTRP